MVAVVALADVMEQRRDQQLVLVVERLCDGVGGGAVLVRLARVSRLLDGAHDVRVDRVHVERRNVRQFAQHVPLRQQPQQPLCRRQRVERGLAVGAQHRTQLIEVAGIVCKLLGRRCGLRSRTV